VHTKRIQRLCKHERVGKLDIYSIIEEKANKEGNKEEKTKKKEDQEEQEKEESKKKEEDHNGFVNGLQS
jgi:hypothetical protein